MRNLMKLIAITAMTALLIFALATCAAADEKIYTSPVFKLPQERLQQAEDIIQAQQEQAELEAEDENSEDGEQPEGSEEIPEGSEESFDGFDEDEFGDEGFDEDGGLEEFGDDAGELESEEPQRRVIIRSSQGEVVTEGEIITLTSELVGFGEEAVTYQWQVDRGDGAGWVDVNGGTESRYTFVADRETIEYSWRLIVNIED